MKINTKTIGGLILAITVFTSINSCKKAEVEQISPYQSANHRILGTWALQSITETSILDYDENVSNNINDDNYTFSRNATSSNSHNGSTMTRTLTSTSKATDKDEEWDNIITPTKSVITTTTIDTVGTITSTENYTEEVSIYKDYTYNSLSTEYTNQFGGDEKTYNSNVTITVNGSGSIYTSDTTFTNMDMEKTSSEGTWSWDESTYGKLQLVINSTSLMSGIITSLSEMELVIETNDVDINNTTNLNETDFYTFDDIANKNKMASGVETTIKTSTVTKTYKQVWKKISSATTP